MPSAPDKASVDRIVSALRRSASEDPNALARELFAIDRRLTPEEANVNHNLGTVLQLFARMKARGRGDEYLNQHGPRIRDFIARDAVILKQYEPSLARRLANFGETLKTGSIRTARAEVQPIRQANQYNCMTTSMHMCLKALGIADSECSIELVNKVMGAKPMHGATWEDAAAAAQHYGCRATLVVPSTIAQMKAWTDAGIPVMIAWNPEGRDWSHASVVFDVDEDHTVHIADPNIPDPEETVRVVPKGEFYSKWGEKWPRYIVRRPAMAIEREITSDGRQVMASTRVPPSVTMVAARHRVASAVGEQIYLDRDQCETFGVDYNARGTDLVVAADAVLRTKRQGYDEFHVNLLKPLGGRTLSLEGQGHGWFKIKYVL